MSVLSKMPRMAEKCAALLLAAALAACGPLNAAAKTTHDELDYTVTVGAKRSTITVKPNNTPDGFGNNHVVNPDAPGAEGVTNAFTLTGKVGSSVTVYAGSADAQYIDHLEESDTSLRNVVGFTYTYGAADETVTVHWKPFVTYFNGNGGTSGEPTKTTEYNHTNTMPGASRSGYDFAGWYTAASGGSSVGGAGTSYTQTASQPTYYAHWTCNHSLGTSVVLASTTPYAWIGDYAHRSTFTYQEKCDTCGAVLNTVYDYPTYGCSDGNNDGECDTCHHNYAVAVTYTLKYKTSSSSSAVTKTQSGSWNSLNQRWIWERFENLGLSSNYNWYKNNWKGSSGAVNTGCATVNQLAAAGYLTGTYYKKNYNG